MPFLLFRPNTADPSELTELDARRILMADFPSEDAQRNVWSKLVKGEKVFVRPGHLQWVRTEDVPKKG